MTGERRSSINIQKVNFSSFEHNNRNYKPNYLIETGLKNEYFNNGSFPLIEVNNKYGNYKKPDFKAIEDDLKQKYTNSTGQKPQKNTEFFKEAVFNTSEKTTKEHIKKLCIALKKEFNITVLNVAHHKDEGHIVETIDEKGNKNSNIKVNFHAHLIFLNVDRDTGKSLRLKKADLVKMQTVVAECLELERGERGSKTVRLSSKQYKQERAKDDILLKNQADQALNQARKEMNNNIVSIKKYYDSKIIEKDNIINKKEKVINELSELNKEAVNECVLLKDKNNELESLFKALGLDEYKQSIKDSKKKYKSDREALKQSGVATQQDYINLKNQHEELTNLLRESFNRYENIKKELDEIKNPTVPEHQHQEQINLSNNKNYEMEM
jgi:hypothetical protein